MKKAFPSPVFKVPKQPKPALRITPIHPKGALLLEHGQQSRFGSGFRALQPPKQFVFPNSDKLVKHLAKTVHFPWEGNKTGTPRLRGASQAHHQKQLESSGYTGQ